MATSQDDVGPEDLLSLDNVTITMELFSTCLDVGCTMNGGIFEANELETGVVLLLSLNNVSWIKVKEYTFADDVLSENVSRIITIYNSISEPFPFDVEEGDTLYVCIEYECGSMTLCARTYRTPSMAIVVPVDIIRPWYFTIDWRLPGVLGASSIILLSIFLISRRRRILVD